jgi:hypothetical protein
MRKNRCKVQSVCPLVKLFLALQHSLSWFRAPSSPTTTFLFFPRLLRVLKWGLLGASSSTRGGVWLVLISDCLVGRSGKLLWQSVLVSGPAGNHVHIFFSRQRTCFEMGPPLRREEGSDCYWSVITPTLLGFEFGLLMRLPSSPENSTYVQSKVVPVLN